MKIKMTKSYAGSYNGMHVRVYEAGEEHEVGAEFMPLALAEVFLQLGVAEQVQAKATPPGPSETKVKGK